MLLTSFYCTDPPSHRLVVVVGDINCSYDVIDSAYALEDPVSFAVICVCVCVCVCVTCFCLLSCW